MRLTAVSCEAVPVELFGEDHGRPAQVGAILEYCLAEGKLGDGQLRRTTGE